ncbi:hypothetical protein Tco_0105993 [Tanacetum coccineum]
MTTAHFSSLIVDRLTAIELFVVPIFTAGVLQLGAGGPVGIVTDCTCDLGVFEIAMIFGKYSPNSRADEVGWGRWDDESYIGERKSSGKKNFLEV